MSYQWWHDREAIRVHYEHFVREPQAEFKRLAEELHQPVDNIPAAMEANTLEILRRTPNRHGWQDTPNLWRQLLLLSDAQGIWQRRRGVFDTRV